MSTASEPDESPRNKRGRELDDGARFDPTGTQAAIAENLSMWCQSKDPTLLRDQLESQSFTIVDMRDPMQPITFVSEGFLAMTGYSKEEIVGHNCRFLQGYAAQPCVASSPSIS